MNLFCALDSACQYYPKSLVTISSSCVSCIFDLIAFDCYTVKSAAEESVEY